jgi:uncharacterized protein (TIGR00369 family)
MSSAEHRPNDEARNDRMRERFQGIYQDEVAFNRLLGLRITRWDAEGVTMEIPFRKDLSAHRETFHGGVVASLVDTAAGAAVMAGHDFTLGSRMSTVSMSISYIAIAPGEGLTATAACTRRGRNLQYVHVLVSSTGTGKPLAEGVVVCNTAERTRPAPS